MEELKILNELIGMEKKRVEKVLSKPVVGYQTLEVYCNEAITLYLRYAPVKTDELLNIVYAVNGFAVFSNDADRRLLYNVGINILNQEAYKKLMEMLEEEPEVGDAENQEMQAEAFQPVAYIGSGRIKAVFLTDKGTLRMLSVSDKTVTELDPRTCREG